MCTKCVDECPTGAIVKMNFPVRKQKFMDSANTTENVQSVMPIVKSKEEE